MGIVKGRHAAKLKDLTLEPPIIPSLINPLLL